MEFHVSLPRLVGASLWAVLAALAGSAASTGVGSAWALAVEPSPTEGSVLAGDADDEDDDEEEDEAEDGESDAEPAPVVSQSVDRKALAQSIVQNNPFCPACQPPTPEEKRAKARRQRGPIPTQLPLELVATMVAAPADDSIAIIAHEQSDHAAPFGPSDPIRPGVTVERITRTRVFLRRGEQLEFLDLNELYCSASTPCGIGMGNCESDDQCRPGLVCAEGLGALYRQPASHSVCVTPECSSKRAEPMSKSFCTTQCPCTSGMGDCDKDEHCLPDHVCVNDNGPQFGKPGNWDVCVHRQCTNGEQDADETGVDCGGSLCGECL